MFAITPLTTLANDTDTEATSSTWEQLSPAWSEVSQKVIDLVGTDHQKILADLSYAIVVGDMCQNLELDRIKFQQTFDEHFGDSSYPSSPAAKTMDVMRYGQTVSLFFGVYVGMLTATGMMERDSFCGAAEQMQADGEGRFWLTQQAQAQ